MRNGNHPEQTEGDVDSSLWKRVAVDEYGSPADEHHLVSALFSPSGRVYLEQLLGDVDPEDFTDPTFGWMWAAACVLHGARQQPVTKRTVLALHAEASPRVESGRAWPAITGLPMHWPATGAIKARIDASFGEPIYPDRLPVSVRVVREAGRRRRLMDALDAARDATVHAPDYSSALEAAHRALGRLEGTEEPAEVVRFDELMDEWQEWQRTGPQRGEVIPSPWPEVNELLSGGLHVGHLTILAGRPGSGKSNAGIGLAEYAAANGYPALLFSSEMTRLDVAGRLAASGARVPYGQITRRRMDAETDSAVRSYIRRNREIPLWIIDKPGITIEYGAAIARTMRRRHGIVLVEFDYLQLLEATDPRVVREQQVSHISRAGKLLARELPCATVMLAQLNRGNAKENREPVASDLRESGSLEQDADNIMLLHHKETGEGEGNGFVDLIIPKSRYGPTGKVNLRWRGDQARIGD